MEVYEQRTEEKTFIMVQCWMYRIMEGAIYVYSNLRRGRTT